MNKVTLERIESWSTNKLFETFNMALVNNDPDEKQKILKSLCPALRIDFLKDEDQARLEASIRTAIFKRMIAEKRISPGRTVKVGGEENLIIDRINQDGTIKVRDRLVTYYPNIVSVTESC